MSELDQLRADLEVLDKIRARYDKDADFTTLVNNMRDRLEAEADPWRYVKGVLAHWRSTGTMEHVTEFIDHLTAELAAKDKRIAELEDAKHAADMVPPFEGPIVGIEPILDPARVLATAAEVMYWRGLQGSAVTIRRLSKDAKPYRLKGGDDGN